MASTNRWTKGGPTTSRQIYISGFGPKAIELASRIATATPTPHWMPKRSVGSRSPWGQVDPMRQEGGLLGHPGASRSTPTCDDDLYVA